MFPIYPLLSEVHPPFPRQKNLIISDQIHFPSDPFALIPASDRPDHFAAWKNAVARSRASFTLLLVWTRMAR